MTYRAPHFIRGLCVAALTLAATTAAAAAISPAATATTPTSSIGGTITTSEVMARAQNWHDRQLPYSQTTFASDLGNTRKYRTDCSGFVDMALHLGVDLNTDGIADNSHLNKIVSSASASLSPATIQTGDVFDDVSDEHTFLFDKWAADGVHMSYWNFGGGNSGAAPPEYHSNETFNAPEVGFEPTSHYAVYRYDNIRADAPPSTVTSGGSFVRVGSDYHGVQIGSNGHAYHVVWDGKSWTRRDLGGSLAGTASIVYHDGRYDIFGLSPAGQLYHDIYTAADGWSGWRHIDGTFAKNSGVTAIYAQGDYRVFGAGPTGTVYQLYYDADGWHSGNLGGTISGTPGVTFVDGQFDVFALSAAGALYHDTYASGGEGWTGWHQADGPTFAKGTGISATYAEGDYRVYGVAPGGDVYQSFYNDGWHSRDLGGTATGTPSITYADSRYDLFVLSPSRDIYHDIYTPADGWGGWNKILDAV